MTSRSGSGRRWLINLAIRLVPSLGRLVQERNDLQQRVAQLRSERDALKTRKKAPAASQRGLHNDDGGDDLRYLFIVTYGRSGSTLLLGVLSSIPGYLIRGENGGAAYHLYKFHATAEHNRTSHSGWRSSQSAWFGIGAYPTRLALKRLRGLLLATLIRPEKDSRVVGFKEIRWRQSDLDDYVDFLRAVFPGARFVINTRNLDDVVVSQWWAKRSDSREVLAEAEDRMLALKTSLGDDAYHIHYDDYVHDLGRLRGLFDWLGEEFDESRVKEVMNKKHSK
ncbi:MAG TPA: sulfotransferase [Nocardioidaceae bacterium]|nr:sulfotransferase [Nocardioidaceae bacterium]